MKILIAEDEKYSRQSFIKQVKCFDKNNSFTILEASDGRQALELFKKETPDLVLSDIKMPFLNGIELLKEINIVNPQTKVIIVSGYADFDYARQALILGAMGYILKPVKDEELEESLNKFLKHKDKMEKDTEYKNIFNNKDSFTRYIYKNIFDLQQEKEFVNRKIFEKIYSKYRLIKIYINNYFEIDKELLYMNIKRISDSLDKLEFKAINFTEDSILMIISESEKTEQFVYNIKKYLLNNNIDLYIGISRKHENIETIRNAYDETLYSVKSKLFFKERELFFENITTVRHQNIFNIDEELRLMKVYVEKFDLFKIKEQIKVILDMFFYSSNLSVECFENVIFKITSILQELILINTPIEESKAYKKLDFNIYKFNQREEIEIFLEKIFKYTIECIKNNKLLKKGIIHRVLDYIENNYNQNLSLKELSENVFFMNNTYLSHLISESTGKSYKNYIKELRINKAKEYLINNKFTITEVATLCGYNDTSQFIQIFKKETGLTPKKYRETYKK